MNIAATPTLSADDEGDAQRLQHGVLRDGNRLALGRRSTYCELLADGGQPVRSFVERHRPHLLRAYGIDCLVNAVEDHAPRFERTEDSVVSRNAPAGPARARGGAAKN